LHPSPESDAPLIVAAHYDTVLRTDDEIDEFWRLRDHARALLWGKRLDIVGIQERQEFASPITGTNRQ
jgi:hypothetical protein